MPDPVSRLKLSWTCLNEVGGIFSVLQGESREVFPAKVGGVRDVRDAGHLGLRLERDHLAQHVAWRKNGGRG